jgi:hypothetical protein
VTERELRRFARRHPAVVTPTITIERAILHEADIMLRRLRRELDARVAVLVSKRLAPIDPVEARYFLSDFRRGDLP